MLMTPALMLHHALLRGQLRRLGLDENEAPSAAKWIELIETVSRTYSEGDQSLVVHKAFLANMSHELRTPLNSILGFARVLDRTIGSGLDTKQREFFHYILHAAEHMLRLVNDLLDLRSLEENKLALERVDLEPVAHEVAGLLQPLFEEKRIHFTLCVSSGLPLAVAERRSVVQILINLLSNAVKFTPAGGSVGMSAEASGSSISIKVSDTGIGIEATNQERLFTYHEQLGAKHAHSMKGSGIGLALTKALVTKQGGSISVESAPNEGSTFTVVLQAAS